jgi:3-hydroxyisobutyrate dehydrogenase-like beta-hydroxyacid dehydrogenase
MTKIHFIGMGKMGLPMATHLAKYGHEVTVSDLSDESLKRASLRGLKVVPLFEGLQKAETVISSLPNDESLHAVAVEIVKHAKTNTLFIDTSTVSAKISEHVAHLLDANGILYLRCPVSGNSQMAESAQLTALASGPSQAYEIAIPLLKLIGPSQFYLGEHEQARVMKLVINLMVVQTFSILGEGFAIGEASGLDWEKMWQVVASSAVASPLLKVKSESLSKRDFTSTFSVSQMQKDVGLILEQARSCGLDVQHTEITAQELNRAALEGLSENDYACIVELSCK